MLFSPVAFLFVAACVNPQVSAQEAADEAQTSETSDAADPSGAAGEKDLTNDESDDASSDAEPAQVAAEPSDDASADDADSAPMIDFRITPGAITDSEIANGPVAAHNAWMLVCCALVLFMTAPGLAMFYSGLVRRKNVLSVMMQCIFLMGLMTVIWALYGYSLAFGGTAPTGDGGPSWPEGYSPYIGNFDYLLMNGVQREWSETYGEPVTPMEGDMTRLTHMLFQGMFFIITPALICGAFAERMKFSAMVVFSILWGTLIYCPLCHWVWDGGLLAYGDGIAGGALDFAGGTVVHISSGVSALVAAILIRPRMGYLKEPIQPHNLTYTALGAAMLWVGLVRIQCGERVAVRWTDQQRVCRDPFCGSGGSRGVGNDRVGRAWQTNGPRCQQWCGGRLGVHHAGGGIRSTDAGTVDGSARGRCLLRGMFKTQTYAQIR